MKKKKERHRVFQLGKGFGEKEVHSQGTHVHSQGELGWPLHSPLHIRIRGSEKDLGWTRR